MCSSQFKTKRSFLKLHKGVFMSDTSKYFLTIRERERGYGHFYVERCHHSDKSLWRNDNPTLEKHSSPLAKDGLKSFLKPWVVCSSLPPKHRQQPDLHCIPMSRYRPCPYLCQYPCRGEPRLPSASASTPLTSASQSRLSPSFVANWLYPCSTITFCELHLSVDSLLFSRASVGQHPATAFRRAEESVR